MNFRSLKAPLKDKPTRYLALVLALGVLVGVFVRAFWLSYPGKQVFDEVYFPVFANNYLHRLYVFDVHPPFGKFLIAIGIWLFGNGGIGWRIMPLLFGFGCIWVVGKLWHSYTKDRIAAGIAMFLVAIDGMFIAYSRTGLMDGILFFFMFATLLAIVTAKDKKPLVWVAVLLGLTVSIKWVGLAIIIPVGYLAFKRKQLIDLAWSLWWSAGVYVFMVGLGQWLSRTPNLIHAIILWNEQAYQYQATLTATHPYASPWWSWPFLLRPVLFLYDVGKDGVVQIMTTLGNPIVWYASTAAVLGSVLYLLYERYVRNVKISDHPLILPLMGWGAAFLPWALVHRVVFLYHYLPSYGFALIILAYWLGRWFRKDPWAVLTVCTLFLAISLYFVPLFVGWWPLSPDAIAQHIWFTRWVY